MAKRNAPLQSGLRLGIDRDSSKVYSKQMTEETKERLSQPAKVVDWSIIKALWCVEVANADLASEFGVTEEAIRAQASRNDWSELRDVIRARGDKSASHAVTGAQNIVLGYKQKISELVGEAGLMTAQGLQRKVKDSGLDYVAQAEAFAVFEPTARVLKPILGYNDSAQINVGVQINAMTEVPEMESFELPK